MMTPDVSRPEEIVACRAAVSAYVKTYWRVHSDAPAYQAAVAAYHEHHPGIPRDEAGRRASYAIASAAKVDPDAFWGTGWRLPPGSFKTG